MSKLEITSPDNKKFKLNVTQFRSPMSAQINSSQTRTKLVHFPIRSGQPDINFTVQFVNHEDKREFESFVRRHQVTAGDKKNSEVILWWPERDIRNWSGYIINYRVSEVRFTPAPKATFGVALVDSMMSEKTNIASRGIDVARILGIQIPAYQGFRDLILIPPSRPSSQTPVNPEDLPRNAGDVPVTPPLPLPIAGGGRF